VKTKKGIFYLLVCCLALENCEEKVSPVCCLNENTYAEIHLINKGGEDLLDPKTIGAISIRDVKLFYLIDGVKKPYYEIVDHPQALKIDKHLQDQYYFIGIILNHQREADESISHFEITGLRTDTLRSHFQTADPSILTIDKVWLNDHLAWSGGATERAIDIIIE
jgi:hypothetical protein